MKFRHGEQMTSATEPAIDPFSRAVTPSAKASESVAASSGSYRLDEPESTRRELRFALSMNGGVSLAIWIGGAVAEIDEIRRGRSAFWNELIRRAGYAPRVQVDVMTGASAGGLNGVLLAQAIRTNRPFRDYLDTWQEVADLDKLTKSPPRATSPVEIDGDDSALLQGTTRELLNGSFFATELKRALSPVPPGNAPSVEVEAPERTEQQTTLSMFASATLVRPNPVALRDAPGNPVREDRSDAYFHVAQLGRAEAGLDGFADQPWPAVSTIDALALIGRATASVPGLFEPVRFAPNKMKSKLVGAFISTQSVEIMDGGVVDNVPISRAIRAIAASRATTPVRRVLLYLHPDPGGAGTEELPETMLGVITSFGGRRSETVREDMELLRAHNAGVLRRRDEAEILLGNLLPGWTPPPNPDAAQTRRSIERATLIRAATDPASEMLWHAPNEDRVEPLLDADDSISGDELMGLIDRAHAALGAGEEFLIASQTRRITAAVMRLVNRAKDTYTLIGVTAEDLEAVRTHAHRLYLLCDLITAFQLAEFLRGDSPIDGLTASRGALQSVTVAGLIGDDVPDALLSQLARWELVESAPGAAPVMGLPEYLTAQRDHLFALLVPFAGNTQINAVIGSDNALAPEMLDELLLPLALEPVASEQIIDYFRIAGDAETPASRAFLRSEQFPNPTIANELGPRIAGRQLAHLGAFFDADWRVNDWWWGRLDAVPALVDAITDGMTVDETAGITTQDWKAELVRMRQAQIVDERFATRNASDPTSFETNNEFLGWKAGDRRIESKIGSPTLTSLALRNIIVATKVIRKGANGMTKVGVLLLQPLLLVLAGIALAGRRAVVAVVWTMCVMAAPRGGSLLGRVLVFALGLAAAVIIGQIVERKIRPKRGLDGYWPYAVAAVGIVVGSWYVFRSDPAAHYGWLSLPAIAAAVSSYMLFFWMNQIVVVVFCGLTTLLYGAWATNAQDHPTWWWPFRTMWVIWIVVVVLSPMLMTLLPTSMLRRWKRAT